MKTEVRFLLAIFLMLGVLIGTNLLFPPIPPDVPGVVEGPEGEAGTPAEERAPQLPEKGLPEAPAPATGAPELPGAEQPEVAAAEPPPAADERVVEVESPLYTYRFSSVGARLVSAEMTQFQSFRREGVVDLLPEGSAGLLGHKVVVGRDTLDLAGLPFTVEPEDGLRLTEGGGTRTLSFVYRHPTQPFAFAVDYTFAPDGYTVQASGRVEGLERPLVVTDLGQGLAYAEVDSTGESRSMAYVANHVQDGITSWRLDRPETGVLEGPFLWAAFRSKFFVTALLAGASESESTYLGGLLVAPGEGDRRTHVQVSQTPGAGGAFAYRLFMGPQEYGRLSSLGEGMEEVNPYGWRFFRPIVRPFVSIIIAALSFLHDQLNIGYGWVLVIFGVLMRVVLWPLNQKAMRAQLRNMAVQPLLQEIQTKYKDNPEKLQKEMMKLYKEHGFNPLAGCLPMLLPWPVLIALFFVFQNAIEFRGVPFLWLPDLSAPDPLYVLPVFLGVSMFLMQWFSMRTLDQANPQMKMMMYVMPIMMVFIFFNLASGLNLYYATANIATIPQQIWINGERKKMRATQGAPRPAPQRG